MPKVEGDIEFKDVTFRYGNRAPALDHISFTIPAGKKVALVGSSTVCPLLIWLSSPLSPRPTASSARIPPPPSAPSSAFSI